MQGASPLASPGLNPGDTGFSFGRRCPRGACPRGCRLALLCRCPRGAYLSPRLPTLPFAYRFSPIPPPPFPAGRGRIIVFLCKGLRPLHPRHLTACGTYRLCRFGIRGQACHGTGHEPAFMKIIGKSSWGFGGFFQEAPNASPFYSFSNAARVQAGFKTHSRSG